MLSVLNALTKTGRTWNNAVSYSTTGTEKFSECLNYFSKVGTYQNRSQEIVNADMTRIFNDDLPTALKIIFGTRLITRIPSNQSFNNIQTGYGRRDEFFKAINWLHINNPELLYNNLHFIPVFGSFKDFLSNPLINTLNREQVYNIFWIALQDKNCGDLVRKYLPQIRSTKKIRSERDRSRVEWAKGFCRRFGISFKQYRNIKNKGLAHIFQRQMGNNEWDKINFNGIPGKAIFKLISGKGRDNKNCFERHGQLDRLMKFVEKSKVIKFTGYPYELAKEARKPKINTIQKEIYNKQFEKCIESFKDHKLGNVLCAVDTSASMTCEVVKGISAYDICISMGVAFSMLNIGYFKDSVIAFNNTSKLFRINGRFCDRINQIVSMETAWGSTNFQSVINEIVRIRCTHPEIPLNEYPDTILVISDLQFNPTNTYVNNGLFNTGLEFNQHTKDTNYEAARNKLNLVGLKDVRIIWWQVNGENTTDFPSQLNDSGTYLISGFDPNVLKSLMGLEIKNRTKEEKIKETPLDGMFNFLSQPIFNLLWYPVNNK